ncbi:MAG: RelA/SpoT domain-containing protein [Solirubrobacteraceae bacterium]
MDALEQLVMPRPFSGSQIERLGIRLAQSVPPDPGDLEQLHILLSAYSEALSEATDRVRKTIGFSPSARIKNTGTILEKLDRYGGSWLKSIQDLAGMRVVRSQTRDEQDALADRILRVFAAEPRSPKVIDRRIEPVQGYRAVHIVVFPDGFPIEIQVRTRLQHEWAELFEKLADQLGRGIRYGEPPEHWLLRSPPANLGDAERSTWLELSKGVSELPQSIIEVADIIDAVERKEQLDGEISETRVQIGRVLNGIGTTVDMLSRLKQTEMPVDELT